MRRLWAAAAITGADQPTLFLFHLQKVHMNNVKVIFTVAASLLTAGAMSSAFATDCVGSCDVTINTTVNDVTNNITTNTITTNFSTSSAEAGILLKSVYDATGTFTQNNSGSVTSTGSHDYLVTTSQNKGDVQVDVTAIGNNFSANLVGIGSANLSLAQRNTGAVTAVDVVRHPNIYGNLEISTTAIGNNASVNWDLTTDKKPSSDNFAVKKDGGLRSFDTVGSFLGSISQCNTGVILAQTSYSQDPAANIKVSTTAIGNNISFGTKTR